MKNIVHWYLWHCEYKVKGYKEYDRDLYKNQASYCRWWLYPFMRFYVISRNRKLGLYHWLNMKGIMKTPHGNVMRIMDVFGKK